MTLWPLNKHRWSRSRANNQVHIASIVHLPPPPPYAASSSTSSSRNVNKDRNSWNYNAFRCCFRSRAALIIIKRRAPSHFVICCVCFLWMYPPSLAYMLFGTIMHHHRYYSCWKHSWTGHRRVGSLQFINIFLSIGRKDDIHIHEQGWIFGR